MSTRWSYVPLPLFDLMISGARYCGVPAMVWHPKSLTNRDMPGARPASGESGSLAVQAPWAEQVRQPLTKVADLGQPLDRWLRGAGC